MSDNYVLTYDQLVEGTDEISRHGFQADELHVGETALADIREDVEENTDIPVGSNLGKLQGCVVIEDDDLDPEAAYAIDSENAHIETARYDF